MWCSRAALPLALLLLVDAAAAQAGNVTGCDLDCKNDGVCQFVSTDNTVLKALVQAGMLIQKCLCPAEFTGLGCELEKMSCNLGTKTCSNGATCETINGFLQEFHCDCAVAATVSTRASQMCRRPYTEYCSSEYKPNEALSFCTNGGKCKGSIIAARIAPGNTTVNAKYEHAGCICPPEFYGPHCEFLHPSAAAALGVPTTPFRPPTAPTAASAKSAPTANSSNRTSTTLAPTPAATATAYPTSESDSMENLFNTYDTTNADGQSGDNSKRSLLLTVLLCVLVAIGLVFFASGYIIYRQRKQKKRLFRLTSRPLSRHRDTTTPTTMTSATDRGSNSGNGTDEMNQPLNTRPMQLRLQPIRPAHEGTADLAPFVLKDSAKDLDDQTAAADDECTIWTEEADVGTTVPDISKPVPFKGGWIKSITDIATGSSNSNNSSSNTSAGNKVEGTFRTSGSSLIDRDNGDSGHSSGSGSSCEYIVDDDDDEAVAAFGLENHSGPYAGSNSNSKSKGNGNSSSNISYLENYRHQAYLVGGDDDIHTIGTAPSWTSTSAAARGRQGGFV